jgi:hypothetical protein
VQPVASPARTIGPAQPAGKIHFLQNEPNFSQCLPRILEKLKANESHFKAKKTQFKPN